MIFTIEKNGDFFIQIIPLPKDFDELVKQDLIPKTQKPILYCVRFKPFVQEELYLIKEDTIIINLIEKFKG